MIARPWHGCVPADKADTYGGAKEAARLIEDVVTANAG